MIRRTFIQRLAGLCLLPLAGWPRKGGAAAVEANSYVTEADCDEYMVGRHVLRATRETWGQHISGDPPLHFNCRCALLEPLHLGPGTVSGRWEGGLS